MSIINKLKILGMAIESLKQPESDMLVEFIYDDLIPLIEEMEK